MEPIKLVPKPIQYLDYVAACMVSEPCFHSGYIAVALVKNDMAAYKALRLTSFFNVIFILFRELKAGFALMDSFS